MIQMQPDILLMTNYRADKALLEEMMEQEALEGNIKLSTVDSAMGQTGTMVIWGTGKTGKDRSSDDAMIEEYIDKKRIREFVREDRRVRVAVTRPKKKIVACMRTDFMTEDGDRAIARYIKEVVKRNPVIKGKEYVKSYRAWADKTITAKTTDPEFIPEIKYYGNGVIMRDMFEGTNAADISHISDCRANINNGHKDLRRYIPKEEVPEGYQPPEQIPYENALEQLGRYGGEDEDMEERPTNQETGIDDIVQGIAAIGGQGGQANDDTGAGGG